MKGCFIVGLFVVNFHEVQGLIMADGGQLAVALLAVVRLHAVKLLKAHHIAPHYEESSVLIRLLQGDDRSLEQDVHFEHA